MLRRHAISVHRFACGREHLGCHRHRGAAAECLERAEPGESHLIDRHQDDRSRRRLVDVIEDIDRRDNPHDRALAEGDRAVTSASPTIAINEFDTYGAWFLDFTKAFWDHLKLSKS